jgi:rod shape-determining protein MreD
MSRQGEWLGTFALIMVAAILLTLVPMPGVLEPLRPYWVAMVLIYRALEVTDGVSLGMAFVMGLLLDIFTASLLGIHALGLVVMIYLVQRFRARLRFFPPWQQALSILALLVNDRIILLWITTLLGEPIPTWQYWLAPLMGMAVWPWLFLLMDRIRLGTRTKKA